MPGSALRVLGSNNLNLAPAHSRDFAACIWYSSCVSDITLVLRRMESGDPDAPAELLSLVYAELRALAARKMAQEQPGQTIQATVLVHEAWYRLGGDRQPAWQSRAHFFGAVAEAMRRILIENARRKLRQKRGGQLERLDVDEVQITCPLPDDQLLALDEALDRLAAEDPRAAEIVKLCFFVGLTQQEAARRLGISLSTVERSWAYARAWLFKEISRDLDRPV
jgi:RNA polymerase sigma factor (TIGR02999 family)